VILRWLVHDFEVEFFSSVVLAITEADVECYLAQWIVSISWNDPIVGVLDTGVSRSTCSWASSTAQLRPRGETTIEAIGEGPHEEAPHEENDDQNC
jgi:hypothetical protein